MHSNQCRCKKSWTFVPMTGQFELWGLHLLTLYCFAITLVTYMLIYPLHPRLMFLEFCFVFHMLIYISSYLTKKKHPIIPLVMLSDLNEI